MRLWAKDRGSGRAAPVWEHEKLWVSEGDDMGREGGVGIPAQGLERRGEVTGREKALSGIRACLEKGCAFCPFRDMFTCKRALLKTCLAELEGKDGEPDT